MALQMDQLLEGVPAAMVRLEQRPPLVLQVGLHRDMAAHRVLAPTEIMRWDRFVLKGVFHTVLELILGSVNAHINAFPYYNDSICYISIYTLFIIISTPKDPFVMRMGVTDNTLYHSVGSVSR